MHCHARCDLAVAGMEGDALAIDMRTISVTCSTENGCRSMPLHRQRPVVAHLRSCRWNAHGESDRDCRRGRNADG